MIKKKRFFLVILFSLILILATYFKVSYHGGEKSAIFKSENQISMNEVISEARKLTGILYDPLQGKYNNIGGRLGLIVCIDVPLLAYQNAGYSIKEAMTDDFKKHPEHYDTKDWNIPENPFFHRRARNLFAYCKGTNRLIPLDQRPMPGDVIFYSWRPNGMLSHIALITEGDGNDRYHLVESAPETFFSKEITNKDVENRGWIPIAFGRLIESEELR